MSPQGDQEESREQVEDQRYDGRYDQRLEMQCQPQVPFAMRRVVLTLITENEAPIAPCVRGRKPLDEVEDQVKFLGGVLEENSSCHGGRAGERHSESRDELVSPGKRLNVRQRIGGPADRRQGYLRRTAQGQDGSCFGGRAT